MGVTTEDVDIVILQGLADGKGHTEISASLSLTVDDINARIVDLRNRLHARNDEHLVALALKTGLIE